MILDEIEARLGEATPGPWKVRHAPDRTDCFVQAPRLDRTHPYDIQVLGDSEGKLYPREQHDADVIFIAHAKGDIADLINEVRALRKELGIPE